ncbi:MAG: M48 family metallopeptidase [Hyphomicrobiaceae bacterium]|nr:M48 family metallopeptidase [Hyphomicrobiaceae bacterium]
MFRAYGLYSHIRANRIRSVLLLVGFVALLHALLYSLLLVVNAFGGGEIDEIMARAADQFAGSWPVAMAAALVWFAISWLFHQRLVSYATGAHGITRREAPKLYNVLENLCISRGIPMPALQIIETPALNAYAAGLKEGQYVIAVTRGLVDTLSDDELEAVLGHELTHIRNRDTQLMVIAIIFAGIFAFFADLTVRSWNFPYGVWPRGDGRRESRGGRDGGGAVLAILIAIAIVLISWGLSTLIRFALSRSREYLADAGSAELTKNPDAMIRALRKIESNAKLDVPSRMEAFFIENPLRGSGASLLSTHPSIDDRVAALEQYAGGVDLAVSAQNGDREPDPTV